jgi:branched-chain amino acid aminotransferase
MDRKSLLWEGKQVDENELTLGLNRAFRYGDGLFETIRVVNGELHLWDLHMNRLEAGMKQLKLKTEENFFDVLKREANELLKQNAINRGGIVRTWVYRSGAGKYTPTSNKAERLIGCESLQENYFTLNSKGLKVEIAESVNLHYHALSPYKTLNALPYVLASQEKQEREFDDLLLTNFNNKIVEATASNLFLVKGKHVITPPITDGALAGVMRLHLMDLIREEGLAITEESVSVNQLLEADEMFLTNSVSGIGWIGAFRKKRYFHDLSLKLIRRLS